MDYPVGQGFDKLRDPIDEDVFDPIAGFTPSPTQTNAIQDVEIAEDEIDFEANFELEAGDTVLIAAFDTAGKPVEITRAFGLRGGRWGSANYFRGPEPDVTALAKGERRQVTVMNVERGLGATIEVASADGTATRRANLQPLATITGRIVSSDGEPLPSPIQVLSVDKGNSIAFSDVKTDNDGIFRVPVVAAPFGYRMYSPNVRGELVENLIVAPGETVDLGAIVNGAERPPIKRTPAKADAASSPTAALTVTATTSTTPPESPAEDEPDTFHFTGKVVDPAGNPVAGAKILVSYYTTAPLNTLPRATTTPSAVSQADGTFAFSMRKDEFDTTNTDFPWEGAHLVAQKPGLGLGWSHVAANDASGKIREAVWSKSRQQTPELREKLTDSTIRLVADDVPIEGRIVDLEGQPIPGTVVRVVELHANRANNLDAWQKVAENRRADYYASRELVMDGFHGYFLQEQLESLLPAVTADADGRFRISGIGRERIVHLQIEPPGFETRHVFTRTRPGQTYEISQHADRPNWRKLTYHGANFTHVAAPSQPLVGVVRDKDSGKPLANVSIRAYSLAGEEISGWSNGYIRTVTDAEGRYELKGLPIGESRVISQAPLSEPYLCINSRFEIAADKPTTLDIALKRGVWIRGQVTDADNRAPLRGRIEYFVFNDNPHRKPAGELLRIEDPFYNTGADGRFSVVGLPGRGLISFMVHGGDDIYPRGGGADKIIGGREEGQPKMFDTSPHYALEDNAHAFVEVNPQESDEAIEANIQLSAGTKIVGAVLDPAGQPLSGYQISGETSMAWFRPINTSEFSVRHLKPGEKRRVLFYHEKQDLAGNLAVDGGDAGPLSVRLEPAGSVQGRIVDDAGLPIADAQIYTGKAKDDVGSGSNVFPDTQKVFTDDDGRFTLKGLAPGVKYSARSGRHGLYLGTIFQNITVASRETKDLGDLNPKSDAELAKSESVEAVTSTPATESGDKPQFEFAGKVLDSDGKPKARASVVVAVLF
jgi:protocatechuate 3,4-dioxygenase beta subunit/5-hydroxyisourate hydrolase-like protein (transthyretin family)